MNTMGDLVDGMIGLRAAMARQLLHHLAPLLPSDGAAGRDLLEHLGTPLRTLAMDTIFSSEPFGVPHESSMVELGHDTTTQMTLYLVSDPPGSVSAAHQHLTWALSAGIEGIERNVVYELGRNGGVTARREVNLARGDVLALSAQQGHSTATLGTTPSRHLNLFGRRLDDLPPFDERRLTIGL